MDVSELNAVTIANEKTLAPYKRLVWALLGILLVFIFMFGGAFFYFMHKAFNMDSTSYVEQSVKDSQNAYNKNG